MTKLELKDNFIDIIYKMSEGNPGALTALIEVFREAPKIDPEDIMGGLGPILQLDTHGIYGSDIYILWNDKCDRDVRKLLLLLRHTQLGFSPENELKELAADQKRELNLTEEEWNEIDRKVCSELEQFKKREPSEEINKDS